MSPLVAAGFVHIVTHARFPNGPTPLAQALTVVESLIQQPNAHGGFALPEGLVGRSDPLSRRTPTTHSWRLSEAGVRSAFESRHEPPGRTFSVLRGKPRRVCYPPRSRRKI